MGHCCCEVGWKAEVIFTPGVNPINLHTVSILYRYPGTLSEVRLEAVLESLLMPP